MLPYKCGKRCSICRSGPAQLAHHALCAAAFTICTRCGYGLEQSIIIISYNLLFAGMALMKSNGKLCYASTYLWARGTNTIIWKAFSFSVMRCGIIGIQWYEYEESVRRWMVEHGHSVCIWHRWRRTFSNIRADISSAIAAKAMGMGFVKLLWMEFFIAPLLFTVFEFSFAWAWEWEFNVRKKTWGRWGRLKTLMLVPRRMQQRIPHISFGHVVECAERIIFSGNSIFHNSRNG